MAEEDTGDGKELQKIEIGYAGFGCCLVHGIKRLKFALR
jgi:hypothetical protein